MHWQAQQDQKGWKTIEDEQIIAEFYPWLRKTLHNIQPGQEYSQGGKYIIINVQTQEMPSSINRDFTMRCKPLVTDKNTKARFDFARKKNLKRSPSSFDK